MGTPMDIHAYDLGFHVAKLVHAAAVQGHIPGLPAELVDRLAYAVYPDARRDAWWTQRENFRCGFEDGINVRERVTR